jgi:hypothetical protein
MTAPAGAVINQGQGNYTVPGTAGSQQAVGANGALATQPTTIANYDPTNNSPLVQGPNGQMVYSQPTPAPVTEQTAGVVYGTTGNAGLDAALQAQEDAANNAANAPDPNDPTVQAGIRAATLASFQQEIDDTNASYAREMSSAVAAGNVGIGNARLQGLYTGEQGSAGAAAGVYNATAKSQSDQATITDQQNTAINALMDKSNAAADATIAADKASKQAGLDGRVTYLQGAQTRNAANAQTAATDAVAAGIDPTQMTPAQIQQYLTNYGISQQDFNSAYATAKQAAADAAVKNEKTVAAGDTVIGADGKPIYTAPDKPAAAPSSVQEYEYATANSGYKGTYTDWLKQQANLKNTTLTPTEQATAQVKTNLSSMSSAMARYVAQNQAKGAKDNFISPAQWNQALSAWTAQGGDVATFVSNYKGYANIGDANNAGLYQGITPTTTQPG